MTGSTSDIEDDRVAIVTGAGSGIGASTARLLASRGLTVALVGRRASPLEEVRETIAAAGGHGFAIPADIGQPDAPAAVVQRVLAETNRVDIIVNNAASYEVNPVDQVTIAEFNDLVAVNVRAPFFLVQAALQALRASPAAVVVNISSAAAAMYREHQTVYGLTKAALEHMTMNLAAELAPDRIRVVCVRPGPVATQIHKRVVSDLPAHWAELAQLVPLGRVGDPDEIARWIWYLVDRQAAWVTGAVLSIDGGVVLGSGQV